MLHMQSQIQKEEENNEFSSISVIFNTKHMEVQKLEELFVWL